MITSGGGRGFHFSPKCKMVRLAWIAAVRRHNRECAFGLSGRGRGGSRLPGRHSTQFIVHEVMLLSTYYCAREAFCVIM